MARHTTVQDGFHRSFRIGPEAHRSARFCAPITIATRQGWRPLTLGFYSLLENVQIRVSTQKCRGIAVLAYAFPNEKANTT